MRHKSIYVIVVTYNGIKWIDKCFGSLINSTIPVKILAIDNASSDSTPDSIRKKFSQVEVIETGQNLGFGKANNIGLKRVLDDNADFAFLLNQDAWIENDTIEKLVNVAIENHEFGILSPVHLSGSGKTIDRIFQNYLGSKVVDGFLSDIYLNKTKPFYISSYANAAAWLITKDAIQKIGFFDPLFKHYGEDDDYVRRLHYGGFKLALVPNSRIYHDRPQDLKRSNLYYKNQVYSLALIRAKRHPKPNKFFLIRKIISNYFTLYLTFAGKSSQIKREIEIDRITINYLNQIKRINKINDV